MHSIELDAGFASKARENLSAAGLIDRSVIHQGDTRVVLPDLLNEIAPANCRLRFALLDASHLYDDVMTEFELVLPHLDDDAIVVFDNTFELFVKGEDPRVNGALKTIVERHGGNLINLEFASWFTPGIALWQRRPKL